jgi:FixJ family two-component response regulator
MTTRTPIITVVDDDSAFRIAVARLLRVGGYQVRTFASAAEFLETPPDDTPGCAIVDVKLPGMSGLQLQDALARQGNQLPLIFITGYGDIPTSVQAIRRGAEDFLTKPVKKRALFDAVQRALARDAITREQRDRHRELRTRFDALTPREREVLMHVLRGQINKQVAIKLGTSERTIKAHRANIMTKLEVESVVELARLAAELGFLGQATPHGEAQAGGLRPVGP